VTVTVKVAGAVPDFGETSSQVPPEFVAADALNVVFATLPVIWKV
jgi:hypothetical protein